MRLSRRRWMTGVLALAFTRPLQLVTMLAGCTGGEPEFDPILRIPLTEIPDEGRIERVHGRVAVEVRREGGTLHARSMICSHQLCRLEWRDQERRYFCPCDEGLFAADGSVVYGPAKKPLRDLEFTIEGEALCIDTYQLYRASADSSAAPADASQSR